MGKARASGELGEHSEPKQPRELPNKAGAVLGTALQGAESNPKATGSPPAPEGVTRGAEEKQKGEVGGSQNRGHSVHAEELFAGHTLMRHSVGRASASVGLGAPADAGSQILQPHRPP